MLFSDDLRMWRRATWALSIFFWVMSWVLSCSDELILISSLPVEGFLSDEISAEDCTSLALAEAFSYSSFSFWASFSFSSSLSF